MVVRRYTETHLAMPAEALALAARAEAVQAPSSFVHLPTSSYSRLQGHRPQNAR